MKKILILLSLLVLALFVVSCAPKEAGEEGALAGEAVKLKKIQQSVTAVELEEKLVNYVTKEELQTELKKLIKKEDFKQAFSENIIFNAYGYGEGSKGMTCEENCKEDKGGSGCVGMLIYDSPQMNNVKTIVDCTLPLSEKTTVKCICIK